MSDWRETIPADVTAVDVEIPHGDVQARLAPAGEPGYLAAESAFKVERSETTLTVRQESGWPSDLEVALPASVRQLRLSTGHGDVAIHDLDLDALTAETGKGDIQADSGGRADLSTGMGDLRLGAWHGPLRLNTGKGRVEIDSALGGLDANTGRGDIRVGDAGGRVVVNSGRGDLVFGRLAGDAKLHTGRGDVVVTDLAGALLELQTSHGNVALDGRVARLRVRLSHGDVSCRCAFVGESFEIVTDHGAIRVEIAEESPLRIEAIAGHGRVESTLPLVKVGRPGPAGAHSHRYVASLGGTNPTATLRLFSGRGNVWLGRPGETAPADDPAAPTSQYDFAESATARAWADTLRSFSTEGVARSMASLGERIGKQVGETVDEAMKRLEREMERLQAEMKQVEKVAEEVAEAEEEREEAVREAEEARAEAEEEREESLAEEAERRAETEQRPAAQSPVAPSVTPLTPPTAPPRPEAPPRPVAPAAAEPPSSEMAVLEAVSRGEITVDEAMVLLNRLEADRGRR